MSHQLKLCTWKELKEVYGIPYCRMHIRRLELKGQFPLRVRLGECRVAWLAHEVEEWIQSRPKLQCLGTRASPPQGRRNSIGVFETFRIEERHMPHTVIAMYDVDGSVGRGGSNFPPDVMLVQFFLSAMSLDSGWNTSPYFSNNFMLASGPAPIFPINGVYQPALADWIASFQNQANRDTSFGPLVVDGRVTPAEIGWFRRHHPPNRRTIQVMNHILFISNQKRFERLDSDPWAPVSLQGALRTFRHNL